MGKIADSLGVLFCNIDLLSRWSPKLNGLAATGKTVDLCIARHLPAFH